jgi:molecular chaperone HtpG
VADDHDMSSQMQKLMEQMGQQAPETNPVFELNPEHQLIKHLNDVQDEENFAQWSEVLLDQALLAERGSLKDPAGFVARLNTLMLDLSK